MPPKRKAKPDIAALAANAVSDAWRKALVDGEESNKLKAARLLFLQAGYSQPGMERAMEIYKEDGVSEQRVLERAREQEQMARRLEMRRYPELDGKILELLLPARTLSSLRRASQPPPPPPSSFEHWVSSVITQETPPPPSPPPRQLTRTSKAVAMQVWSPPASMLPDSLPSVTLSVVPHSSPSSSSSSPSSCSVRETVKKHKLAGKRLDFSGAKIIKTTPPMRTSKYISRLPQKTTVVKYPERKTGDDSFRERHDSFSRSRVVWRGRQRYVKPVTLPATLKAMQDPMLALSEHHSRKRVIMARAGK